MLQNFNMCDKITPVNVKHSADTALLKVLVEMDVTVVGDLHLRVVEESGKNHGPVNRNLV